MPSDIVVAAVILSVSIGGGIWWAQRDRTWTAETHWGRKDNEFATTLKELAAGQNSLRQELRTLKNKQV